MLASLSGTPPRRWLFGAYAAFEGQSVPSKRSNAGHSRATKPPALPRRPPTAPKQLSPSIPEVSQQTVRERSHSSVAGSPRSPGGQQQQRQRPGRPCLAKLVVVEGHNDRIAVQRAVDAQVGNQLLVIEAPRPA
jgi:hypothetical protein